MRVLACAVRFLTADEFVQLTQGEGSAQQVTVLPLSAPDLLLIRSGCSQAEAQLSFVGLCGIVDPPRAEVCRPLLRALLLFAHFAFDRSLVWSQVRAAIAQCKKAGIRVSMITGDHSITAISIAQSIGKVFVATFRCLTRL
jgi:magnesium-transporting ATPase (P-type)